MESNKKARAANSHWIKNPSVGQVALVGSVWFFGSIFLVISITDFFRESFFNGGNFLMYILLGAASLVFGLVLANFLRHRKEHFPPFPGKKD